MTLALSLPRVAIGGILHETHSFAEPKTGIDRFREQSLDFGEEITQHMTGTPSAIGGMLQAAAARGWLLVPTVYAAAMPSGIVEETAYQVMLQELLARLKASTPVDAVLLALHGAMVTEDHLDAEQDILEKVREIVGPAVPIALVLDMHGNISPSLVEVVDLLVAFDSNPHTDPHARGVEAVEILERILQGKIQPCAAYIHPPLLLAPQATGTADLPLRAVHARVTEMEKEESVLCICVMGGFAYADTPFTGASIVVTTDNNPELAEHYARELAEILMSHQQAASAHFLAPEDAVARAQVTPDGPVILVDSADNIGGGAPGDGTAALQAMLKLNVQEGTVILADKEAVDFCWAAGEGATLTIAVGGKSDHWHGQPVVVTGTIRKLSNGIFECERPDNHFASFYGRFIDMGSTVLFRCAGINIILTTRKTPPFDLAQLRCAGVIPEEQKMIVVKSAVAYRAAYVPITSRVIEMDTPGLCSANLARFPYRHLRHPIFPLDRIVQFPEDRWPTAMASRKISQNTR
jgi:microcystin degradation protein MlrC